MKKLILSLAAFGSFVISSRAADLLVDINGGGGAYTSIQTAIDAATAGDRIMIVPNGVPFSENLTINKSISLLCQAEGAKFNLQGDITINSNATLAGGSVITISGARVMFGNVSVPYAPPASRVKVNILNSKFDDGVINLDNNNYDLRMQDDSLLNGTITFRYGQITGCYIKHRYSLNTSAILINSDSQPSNDIIYIVGNKIVGDDYFHPSYYDYLINPATTSHYFNISNNHIKTLYNNQYGMYIYQTKSGAGQNHLVNNTFDHAATNYQAIYILYPYSSIIAQNNLFAGAGTVGIYLYTSPLYLTASYNHFNTSYTTPVQGFTDNGTNVTGGTTTINSEGKAVSGTAVDAGNPDFAFWDLDNTSNDAGCFGGSWSRENFLSTSPNSRTSIVFAPRRVVSGNTININAQGYDK